LVVKYNLTMPTTRSYRDRCPIARALDAVGERWGLLVVRELLLGPQRFSDLRHALPGASSNMLTDRLRELEARGIVRRRALPPPAASSVYELTERGRGLEPVLDALGSWGAAEPPPVESSLSASAVLLFLRGSLRAHPPVPMPTLAVALDDRVWTLGRRDGAIEVDPGEPERADTRIRTDPETLNDLVLEPDGLAAALRAGAVGAEGDLAALRRLLDAAAGRRRAPVGS
jgi:DNA-binding HxlR family transcriptional regulator